MPVLLDDLPLTAAVDLRDDSGPEPDELVIGSVRLVVHVSGGSRAIRVRDPDGPQARGFLGFTWFPIDAQYRVVGRLIRDAAPQRFKVLNTYGRKTSTTLRGSSNFSCRARRFASVRSRPGPNAFTSCSATRRAATRRTRPRASSTPICATATRPCSTSTWRTTRPCAFNPYTTCPIPLRENRLPVKILAGEKAYPVHVPLPGGASR